MIHRNQNDHVIRPITASGSRPYVFPPVLPVSPVVETTTSGTFQTSADAIGGYVTRGSFCRVVWKKWAGVVLMGGSRFFFD